VAGRPRGKRRLGAVPDLACNRSRNWTLQRDCAAPKYGPAFQTSGGGDVLFIEFTFTATVGGGPLSWDSVDRFIFRDGQAVERISFFQDSGVVLRHARRSLKGWMQILRLASGR